MADTPQYAQLRQIARREMLVQQPRLAADAVDREGSDANALIAAIAAVGDSVSGQLARAWSAFWRGSATGDDLKRLAADRYNLQIKPAAYAIGQVTFTLTTANPTLFVVQDGCELATTDGRKFKTIGATPFPVGALTLTVPVISLLAGVKQQARAGTITSIVSTITNAPTTMTVTNAQATAGAADEESNDQLNQRIGEFLAGVGGGNAAAVRAAALAVPGVTSAATFETINSEGLPDRAATLVVTDQFTDALVTSAPEGSATYDVQCDAFAKTVFAGLADARPLGMPIYTYVARVRVLTIRLALTFSANADQSRALAQALAAVVAYTNLRRPGQPWIREKAQMALQSVPGLVLTGQEIAYPPGNVIPSQYEVLRTSSAFAGLAL